MVVLIFLSQFEIEDIFQQIVEAWLVYPPREAPPFVEPPWDSRSCNFWTIFYKPSVGCLSNVQEVYPGILVVIQIVGLWIEYLREIDGSLQRQYYLGQICLLTNVIFRLILYVQGKIRNIFWFSSNYLFPHNSYLYIHVSKDALSHNLHTPCPMQGWGKLLEKSSQISLSLWENVLYYLGRKLRQNFGSVS